MGSSVPGALPELDQEVFRWIHLRGRSENETFHALKALWPGLTREQLLDAVARVGKSIEGRQSWLLLVRRPRMQSLTPAPPEPDAAQRSRHRRAGGRRALRLRRDRVDRADHPG